MRVKQTSRVVALKLADVVVAAGRGGVTQRTRFLSPHVSTPQTGRRHQPGQTQITAPISLLATLGAQPGLGEFKKQK